MAASIKWRLLAICVIGLVLKVGRVNTSAEVVKKMTIGFAKVLEQCKKEINLGDGIMQDFYNFWKEDYALVNVDVGCALMCMASKLDLVADDNNLHHGNAHEFAKSHGAGEALNVAVRYIGNQRWSKSHRRIEIEDPDFRDCSWVDDDMAKQLVSIIHECEKTHAGITDDCGKTLEIAKCFRSKIHGLKWAPDMETVLEEVMTEIKA